MPSENPMILRDVLAMDRTSLANERTLLAYVRTAVGLVAGGVGLTQLVPSGWAMIVGWGSASVGVLTALIGLYRFFTLARRIQQQSEETPVK